MLLSFGRRAHPGAVKIQLLAYICAGPLLATGCGGSTAGSMPAKAEVQVHSGDLFAATTKLLAEDPAATATALAKMRALTWGQYYDHLVATTSDDKVAIDGVTLQGMKSSLRAHRQDFLAAAQGFRDIGAIWDAAGFQPLTLTLSQFTNGWRQATGASVSASLDLLSYTEVRNWDCNPTHDKLNKYGYSAAVLSAGVEAAKMAADGGPITSIYVPKSQRDSRLEQLFGVLSAGALPLLGRAIGSTRGDGTIRMTTRDYSLPKNYFDDCFKPDDNGPAGAEMEMSSFAQ